MIGSAFRKLAARYGMAVSGGMAYGDMEGCFVTLTEGTGYKRMSIYVGGQVAAPDGSVDINTVVVQNAHQIAQMIAVSSGEDNIYCLMTKNKAHAMVLNHAASVVTVNFYDNPGTMACIERFVAEMLPKIAPMCQPRQCICCCRDVTGMGYPVRIASDTVVPMHGPCMERAMNGYRPARVQRPGNMTTGILGASAGALLGAVAWVGVYRCGYIASVIGALIAVLASWGYDLGKGKKGTTKLVTILICSLLAICAGMASEIIGTLHSSYQQVGTVVQGMLSEFTYIKAGISLQLQDAKQLAAIAGDILFSMLFALLGCFELILQCVRDSAKAGKPRKMKGSL